MTEYRSMPVDPTVLLRVDKCARGCARPPCSVVNCHTAVGLSPSPPPAPASSSASHFLSAAAADQCVDQKHRVKH